MTVLPHRPSRLGMLGGISALVLLAGAAPASAGYSELVSQRDSAGAPNGQSLGYRADASPDGRFVVFESTSTNLACCGGSDHAVYIRDTVAKTTRLVSATGAELYSVRREGHAPSVSDNGQRIAFVSSEALVPADTNGKPDVYVRLRGNGSVRLVSRDRQGNILQGASPAQPRISGDGGTVVFTAANNVMGYGQTTKTGVYRVDLDAQQPLAALVSSTDGVTPANGNSTAPDVARDGSVVGYHSDATNLVGGKARGVYSTSWVGDKPVVKFESFNLIGDFKHPFATPEPSLSRYGGMVAYEGMWADYDDSTGYSVAAVFDRGLQKVASELMPTDGRTANADGVESPSKVKVDGRSAVLSDNGEFLLVTTRPIKDPYTLSDYQMTVRHLASGVTRTLTQKNGVLPASGFGVGIADDGLRVTFLSRAGNLLVPNGTYLFDKGQVFQQILPNGWWIA